MEQVGRRPVPAWFWIVAVLALLWEAMGCVSYLAEVGMLGPKMAQHTPEEAAVWGRMPAPVWAAFALAVWVGIAGAVLLLLRKRLARGALAVSLLAALVQFGWAYAAGGAARLGAAAAILPACIILFGALLVWFATVGVRRGWLS